MTGAEQENLRMWQRAVINELKEIRKAVQVICDNCGETVGTTLAHWDDGCEQPRPESPTKEIVMGSAIDGTEDLCDKPHLPSRESVLAEITRVIRSWGVFEHETVARVHAREMLEAVFGRATSWEREMSQTRVSIRAQIDTVEYVLTQASGRETAWYIEGVEAALETLRWVQNQRLCSPWLKPDGTIEHQEGRADPSGEVIHLRNHCSQNDDVYCISVSYGSENTTFNESEATCGACLVALKLQNDKRITIAEARRRAFEESDGAQASQLAYAEELAGGCAGIAPDTEHCEPGGGSAVDSSGAAWPEQLQLGTSGTLSLRWEYGKWVLVRKFAPGSQSHVIIAPEEMDALVAAVRVWRVHVVPDHQRRV